MSSASKTSAEDEGPVIDMADLGRRVTARRIAADIPELPRNGGEHRTESKRALLRAIQEAGGNW